MSMLLEFTVVFVVMSVLVTLFTWIYVRDRRREFGLWMLGFIALFLHAANPVVAILLSWPRLVDQWISAGTLILAGTFFLLSVSQVFRNKNQRLIFIFMIGV